MEERRPNVGARRRRPSSRPSCRRRRATRPTRRGARSRSRGAARPHASFPVGQISSPGGRPGSRVPASRAPSRAGRARPPAPSRPPRAPAGRLDRGRRPLDPDRGEPPRRPAGRSRRARSPGRGVSLRRRRRRDGYCVFDPLRVDTVPQWCQPDPTSALDSAPMSTTESSPMTSRPGPPRARAGGARPAAGRPPVAAAARGDRRRLDPLRPLPDPGREHPAREPRPAPRRLRLGASLQLPAGRRVEGRGEDRRHRVPEDRPPRRRDARARPALPRAADRGARPAGRDPRQGEPEELDRPARRVHPGAHRRQPVVRRDPVRLPRQALPRGRAAVVRDPREDRARAQPAPPLHRRRPVAGRRDPDAPRGVPAALPRLARAASHGSSRSPTGSS